MLQSHCPKNGGGTCAPRLTRCNRPPRVFQRVLPEQREPGPAHGERALAVLGAVVQRGPGRVLRRPPRPQEAAQPRLAPGKHCSEGLYDHFGSSVVILTVWNG